MTEGTFRDTRANWSQARGGRYSGHIYPLYTGAKTYVSQASGCFSLDPLADFTGIKHVSFKECRLRSVGPAYRYKRLSLNISRC